MPQEAYKRLVGNILKELKIQDKIML